MTPRQAGTEVGSSRPLTGSPKGLAARGLVLHAACPQVPVALACGPAAGPAVGRTTHSQSGLLLAAGGAAVLVDSSSV